LGPRAQQFSGGFIAAPAASIIALARLADCARPGAAVIKTPVPPRLLSMIGLLLVRGRVHDPFPSCFIAHKRVSARIVLPLLIDRTRADRKLLTRKTCQLARDVQEYAPV